MQRTPYYRGMRILAKLRSLFRRAPASAGDSEPVAPDGSIQWGRIKTLLAEAERPPREEEAPRSSYKLPAVLPGVRPETLPARSQVVLAMDSGYEEPLAQDNAPPAAWGFTGNGALGPGLAFLGFPYLAELAQITEYRTPAEALSTEMTRAWVKLVSKDKKKDLGEKIKDITDRLESLKVRDLFREAALKTEQFGRAHIYVSVKGQDDDRTRQVPLKKIEKGSLVGFSCIEPYWLTPYSWNSTHPERPDFYKPQSWFVLGRKTHSSRLLTFIFREVPDLLKPAYDFSGISITQLMMPYVNRWLRTAKNVNDLINIFSIVTLATDMQQMLQAGANDPSGLPARMQAFTHTRDNRGAMVINKDTEELSTQNVPLGSLDKLQAQAQEHMATPSRMPLIEFFGITPTGLNSSSEGEFQARNKYVKGMIELGFAAHFRRVHELVQMDLYGEIDPDITEEWQNLYEPTPKEESELRKADADRDAVYLDNSVIAADEVRDKLKNDPKSGYDNLQGDAPEPPEMTEFGLGEASATNAHNRSEESAEAAHARQMEVQTSEEKE